MKALASESEFDGAISSPETIIIKFETTWCPDCKRLNQYVDEFVQAFDFDWYSADRDLLPQLGEKYDVLGIPSLLAFKNGKKIGHLRADNQTPEQIKSYLTNLER